MPPRRVPERAMWQADHTQLDIVAVEAWQGQTLPATVVVDDCSRAVPATPSACARRRRTSLALRQAIWTKPDPAWLMCGIPEIRYGDRGSDFASEHLTQVAADLWFRIYALDHRAATGPYKVKRFFGSISTNCSPSCPSHHLVRGKPVTAPMLSLRQFDDTIGELIAGIQ
ncbi:hypothetical protein ACQP1G_20205 [Nocardia sp. CA-107356]|uniref:hypothetical protein n=1 Tax=Nocardia sp. CA-107356 TaxID=3239972 RepID=UPI003D8C89DB